MTTETFTKVCFMFRPDDETTRIIGIIAQDLLDADAPVTKKEGDLPYHMTIIGGGKVEEATADETLTQILRQMKPFSEGAIPTVRDIEPAQMYGDYIAIRLKLNGYVITGNIDKNRALPVRLKTKFNFNSVRHITLCSVSGENKFRDADDKLEKLEHLLLRFREPLLQMGLTPEVWVKPHGSNIWRRWP